MLDRVVFSCQQNGVNTFSREDNSIQELFPLLTYNFLKKIQFLNNYDRHWHEAQHTCSLSNEEPITTRQVTLWFVYPECFILMPSIIVYIEKIVFFDKNAGGKREITQIRCWIELSSLVKRTKFLFLFFIFISYALK
jgi:hypothetical protein